MSDEMTRSRGKQSLPQGWSYPLSARDVECQLQGVRIPPELTLSFHWRSFGLRASEHLALVRAGSALPVLEASYLNVRSRTPPMALGRELKSYLRPYWSICVYAVPRSAREACREALLATGLPVLCKWLSADRPDTWYEGHRTFSVLFVLATGALTVREAA